MVLDKPRRSLAVTFFPSNRPFPLVQPVRSDLPMSISQRLTGEQLARRTVDANTDRRPGEVGKTP
jgi:hypothetical protein